MIGNIIWFVLAGWWLALGHLLTAICSRHHHHRHPLCLGPSEARGHRALADRQGDRAGLAASDCSFQCAPPPSSSCAAAKNLHTRQLAGQASGVAEPCPPRPCLPSTDIRANRPEDAQALEADARLRDDIRLLGRILGDTVRDQEGADVFDLVERIRQTSIRFHRDDDRPARRELEAILDSMSTAETVRIVRAFSYFSHLANIAEDQNNIRQMRGHAAPAERRVRARWRRRWRMRATAGHQRRRPAQLLRERAGQPGADRAPDRGPPQEHAWTARWRSRRCSTAASACS